MGWIKRGEKAYLYWSHRVNGQVTTLYLGRADDPLTRGMAREIPRDARELARRRARTRDTLRACRAAEAQSLRERRSRLEGVLALGRLVEHAAMERAGYHRHDRGAYRRRRVKTTPETPPAAPPAPPAPPAGPRVESPAPQTVRLPAPLKALIDRAQQGDSSCLPPLRALVTALDAEGLDLLADAARRAEEGLLERAYGTNLLLIEAARRKLAALRDELAGPQATVSERLLAERAAFCWFNLNVLETIHHQRAGELTPKQALFQQRQIALIEKRYLAVLKALAAIRRAPPPVTQIIGRRQAIVVGAPPAPAVGAPPAPGPSALPAEGRAALPQRTAASGRRGRRRGNEGPS